MILQCTNCGDWYDTVSKSDDYDLDLFCCENCEKEYESNNVGSKDNNSHRIGISK